MSTPTHIQALALCGQRPTDDAPVSPGRAVSLGGVVLASACVLGVASAPALPVAVLVVLVLLLVLITEVRKR